jgi:hypothetical protein
VVVQFEKYIPSAAAIDFAAPTARLNRLLKNSDLIASP